MGINLISDIVLQQFAASAKRFALGAESVVARYGDEVLDGRQAFQQDIMSLRTEFGLLARSYGHVVQQAPEAVAALPTQLREELTSALRAAKVASDGWPWNRGTSSVAPFAALADAATGAAEIAASGAPFARPVRVVVGGDGPAGLATANLLREAGADVWVFSPTWQARTGSVMIDRRGWGVLERAGGGRVVAEAPLDGTGNFKMASIPWLERDLGEHAHNLGVRAERGYEVSAVEHLDEGVRVQLTRPRFPEDGVRSIDADWYVDATGGSSPVSSSETFQRDLFQGTFGALPSQRTFIATSAKALDDQPLGWTGADGAFAINDAREGVLTAYRGLDEVDTARKVSTEEATALLRSLDVDPATMIGTPWSFTAQQSLARSAGQGRVLIVGDGAGTVMPVQQAGMFLALTDAERAANTIIGARHATRGAIDDAVRQFDAESRLADPAVAASRVAHVLERIADDAEEVATAATDKLTRAHDDGTRMMHRVFLA